MDITRENFAEHLPRVRAAISRCSFMAMDCEFTGLSSKDGTSCPYDTPEERYVYLKNTTEQFIIIQFGLSTFTQEKEKQRYAQETFNFYLFPRHHMQGSFLCQPSSLEFLVGSGFDFNRLIKDGIPYLRPAQLDLVRKELDRQTKKWEEDAAGSRRTLGNADVPLYQKSFFDTALLQIRSFLNSSKTCLDFVDLTRFQRKLLYDNASNRLNVPLEIETIRCSDDHRILRIRRVLNKVDRRAADENRFTQRINEAAGFSRVVDAISKSGKPLVGHNMVLDLIHFVHQFVCPLPDTYAEFKSVVTGVLPCLVDTKVMASTQPFKDQVPSTQLSELESTLRQHPFRMPKVVPVEGSDPAVAYKAGDDKEHEAGFDAFVTALCFSAMVGYLGLLLTPSQPCLEVTADIVKPFTNKLFALNIADMPYLDLTGDDVAPPRGHVFHLTFDATWNQANIVRLFKGFGRVRIRWLDNTSAFVSLDRREEASRVLQSVRAHGLVAITNYVDWRRVQRLTHSAGAGKSSKSVSAAAESAAAAAARSSSCPGAAAATSRRRAEPADKAAPTISPAAVSAAAAAASASYRESGSEASDSKSTSADECEPEGATAVTAASRYVAKTLPTTGLGEQGLARAAEEDGEDVGVVLSGQNWLDLFNKKRKRQLLSNASDAGAPEMRASPLQGRAARDGASSATSAGGAQELFDVPPW